MVLSIIIDHFSTKYGVSAEGNKKKRQAILAELDYRKESFLIPEEADVI